MKNLISKLIQLGTKLVPQGNKPLMLNDEGFVYVITQSNLDVFLVDLKNGIQSSSRKHVARFSENELIFGLNSSKFVQSKIFIAVGNPDTVVYSVSKDDFSKLLEDKSLSQQGYELLEKSINKFLFEIFKPLLAKDYLDFASTDKTSVEKGKCVLSRKHFFWITILEGQCTVCGDKNIIVGKKNIFILSDMIYITPLTNCRLEKYTSKEIFKKNQLWSSVDNIFQLMVKKIFFQEKEFIKNEISRFKKRKLLKEISLKKGIYKLINILKKESKWESADRIEEGDNVLACCNLLGKYIGEEFLLPKDLPENIDDVSKFREIIRVSKVKMRKVVLDINWWKHDNGPMLAFNSDNHHLIVLIPKSPRKYFYIDKITKEKFVINEKNIPNLENFAYFFYRTLPNKPLSWKDLLKFGVFMSYRDFASVIIVGVGGALLGLLNPYLTGQLFDKVIPSSSVNELGQMIFLLISAAIAITMFELTKAIAMVRFEGRMDKEIQASLWDRLLSLKVSFFKRYTAGDLANRSMGIDSIRQILSGVAVQSILAGIFAVFYCIQLFYYNYNLALIGLGLGMIILVIVLVMGYVFVKFQIPVQEIEGKITGMVLQFINGIGKIRITGSEDFVFYQWANEFGEKKKLAFKAGLAQASLRSVNSVFPIFASMVIFSYVVNHVDRSLFSIGDFAAYTSAYGQFQNALLQMGIYITASLTIIPFYKRLKPIITQVPEVDESKAKPGKIDGNIGVFNVNFRYDEDGPLILKNLSLEIKRGEFVAIVGPSGSGKSTITRMLLGFETPESGAIYYDGQDLFGSDVNEVRKQIGVVLQNSEIMMGSILDNILGSTNLTIDDAWEAAESSGLAEDIKEMPMGMHTVLPFGGGTISGGQRQRILIARAIVRKPRILIFDEATSALDNRTQKIVSDSLDQLNATKIVIAHRLSTIKNADRILFLDNGEIVEQGTYGELMKMNGLFANSARRQLA